MWPGVPLAPLEIYANLPTTLIPKSLGRCVTCKCNLQMIYVYRQVFYQMLLCSKILFYDHVFHQMFNVPPVLACWMLLSHPVMILSPAISEPAAVPTSLKHVAGIELE